MRTILEKSTLLGAQTRSPQPGHLAEVAVVKFLRTLPGVASAEISSEVDDHDEVDVLLRLQGDYVPLKLQLTGNPKKSPKGLPKDICFVKYNLGEVLEGISPRLGKDILFQVITWAKRFSPETLEGLYAYWGI